MIPYGPGYGVRDGEGVCVKGGDRTSAHLPVYRCQALLGEEASGPGVLADHWVGRPMSTYLYTGWSSTAYYYTVGTT